MYRCIYKYKKKCGDLIERKDKLNFKAAIKFY